MTVKCFKIFAWEEKDFNHRGNGVFTEGAEKMKKICALCNLISVCSVIK